MRLIAFGCSHTYGNGLDDCWIDKDRMAPKPSQYAWPSVLSDMLNIECINMAIGGASNKQILDAVLNFDFRDDDITFIKWTHFDRYCVHLNDGTVFKIGNWKNDITNKSYFAHVHSFYDSYVDFCIRSNYAKFYLDSEVIEHYHLTCADLYNPKYKKLKWDKATFLKSRLSHYRDKYPKALDGLHAGKEAQYKYAESIYREIKEKNEKDRI